MLVTDWAGHAVVTPHRFMGTIMSLSIIKVGTAAEIPSWASGTFRKVGGNSPKFLERAAEFSPSQSPKGGGQKGQSAGVGVTFKGFNRDGSEELH